jgi:hypothetical protein
VRWIVAGLGVLGTGIAVAFAAEAEEPSGRREPSERGGPVLVELFTSEGCSSCPPADAVLTRLEDKQPVRGAFVIGLAHHVDYWDSLGWPDPFASAAATARQRSYGGNYTPQAIVDGSVEMVGSHASALEAAIADAAKRPHVTVTIASGGGKGAFVVCAPTAHESETFVALVHVRARVAVTRGENAGRTLDHTGIVRELRPGPRVTFAPPSGVAPADLRVVAFVQDGKTRRILGSAQAPFSM